MTQQPLDIAVLGAGPTGLTAALLLARDGHRVTVCEADGRQSPDGSAVPRRPGVSQFGLPHVLLPRWRHEMDAALPDLAPTLLTAGARPLNLLHLQDPGTTGSERAGDDRFGTVAVGRAVLEQVLGNLAAGEPNVRLRFATRATGLLPSPAGERRLGGLRTEDDDVPAELVIDAAGRHSPMPGWLHDYGVPPQQRRHGPRLTFFCRYFETLDGSLPQVGPILTHHPSWSLLTLPTGRRRFAVVLVATAEDRALRALRDPDAWHAAVASTAIGRAWAGHGRPVSGVLVHSAADAVPAELRPAIVGRLVALGDAHAVTNPLLGRGVTIGALSAVTLRDSLHEAHDVAEALVRYRTGYAERVAGWVDSSVWLTRHRAAELRAHAAGERYHADDVRWTMTVALRAGALQDPVLARASTLVGGMLADAAEVFANREVRDRCGRYLGAPTSPSGAAVEAGPHDAVRSTPPTSPIGEEPSTTQGAHHVHLAR